MALYLRLPYRSLVSVPRKEIELLRTVLEDAVQRTVRSNSISKVVNIIPCKGFVKNVQTSCRISFPRATSESKSTVSSNSSNKKMVPDSDPPSSEDVNRLYELFEKSSRVVVLTGAGMSTECGIPDYRSPNGAYSTGFKPITLFSYVCSPNGAYSTGFKPITHQEFLRSQRARRRYWARSYAGWRRFTASQPGSAHIALSSLEKAGRVKFMITQNVDRLHHRAGSNPLELHGSVYTVVCTECGFSLSRSIFQDEVKSLNPKWAAAIESLDYDSRSDQGFGMRIRPDGDIEIDEKFWEEEFHIPGCHECGGILKPDVVFFGDNVPKDRADAAMEAAKGCDALLVLGSSLMTMSAFRLVRAAHEAGATTAIVSIGKTRADEFVPIKINARIGEILPRVLAAGSLSVPVLD